MTPAEIKCLVKVVMSDVGNEAAALPKPERPFPGGLYVHFKGGLYRVLYIARDSDTLEDVVVYANEVTRGLVWTRKLSDWMSLKDGKIRFQRFMEK